ncbi:DNA-binding transcriptional regulator, GntR family [Faunimonas pinastri]|uniref:DNA-binding transcriptional regulator, GntR family n=2 Tax=Faunimonas pinastri TaxID=1855383 RepID=A0A1H9E2G0_9HYPH|nr:DNA-binding transcriptional regulator, GntR family [Faunimonas pinastri]
MLRVPDKRLALQAYEQILELILTGKLQPGELVNERRLAEILALSRTPVRDALLMLEGEGLLLRQGSRGLQIRQVRIEDYMDALQIRLMLEPAAARIAAGKVAGERLSQLTGQLQSILAEGDGKRADRAVVREVDEALHGTIADAVGNPQLSSIIRTLRRQTLMFDLRSMPERLGDTCREHMAILAAIGAGDGETAAAAMASHLGRVRDSIIQRLTRT